MLATKTVATIGNTKKLLKDSLLSTVKNLTDNIFFSYLPLSNCIWRKMKEIAIRKRGLLKATNIEFSSLVHPVGSL